METFNALYPYIILFLGLFDAVVIGVGGTFAAGMYLFRPDTEMYDRVFPSFIIVILSTVGVAASLAGTRWMLGGL